MYRQEMFTTQLLSHKILNLGDCCNQGAYKNKSCSNSPSLNAVIINLNPLPFVGGLLYRLGFFNPSVLKEKKKRICDKFILIIILHRRTSELFIEEAYIYII